MSSLRNKIADYFRERPEVIAVYLFGSYARGKAHRFSDVDVGVLMAGRNSDFHIEKKKEYMTGLARRTRKDVDLVILNSLSEVFLRQIFLEGECILVNDPKKLSHHKMVMFAKIAEFGYYRPQMESGFITNIMEA